MLRGRILGIVILAFGALIVLYKLSVDGLSLSFVMLFGALCVADGAIRLMLTRPDPDQRPPDDRRRRP